LLLLESTGGVTQAFAYVFKAVRLLKKNWDIDFVMRLVTEYKGRAARGKDHKIQQEVNSKYVLDNIHLLDKELARIDLMLAGDSADDEWMATFGLPELLALFETWQRAPDFLLRQLQTADVMKKDAERLLDLFTGCFSTVGAIPELGLGNAEIKVVCTAWNRHLLLYNNARIYVYRSWVMQFTLYFLGFLTTTLSILITNYDELNQSFLLTQVMLIVPIITALLGTVSTRLRTEQKYSACKMASFEIVSEIYKFRVRGMEYDQQALSATLAEKKNPTKDKKKKDENEITVPISSKERDKFSRTLFVERVSNIYTSCMNNEMSKGTSITHQSRFGMDPARLLRDNDSAPDDSEKETRKQLQEHVANRLYFMTTAEWKLGVDAIKAEREATAAKNNKRLKLKIEGMAKKITVLGASITFKILELSILVSAWFYDKLKGAVKGGLEQASVSSGAKNAPAPPPPETHDEEMGEGKARKEDLTPTQQKLNALKERFAKYFNADLDAALTGESVEEDAPKGKKGKLLDETYVEEDEDAADAPAAAAAPAGGAKRIRDDFFSTITITDYMDYRAKPVLAYFERTAPWRGFWMQVIEILIFTLSASGAALVGMGQVFVPYVAMTVAAANIARSFLEFSNLSKQVEAYNMAINQVHNMMNAWDSMTRTERRRSQTVKLVVGTIESALQIVAVALTDALPSGQGEDEEEEEEAKEE